MPIVLCKSCKKKFYAKPNWLRRGWGKYCSLKCSHEGNKKGKFVHCLICSKEIWRKPRQLKHSKSQSFFCSKSHQTLWRNSIYVGPKHPNWKGGISIEYEKLLLRHGNKPMCKLCGSVDRRIMAVHHIDKNPHNNDIKNLVWLCHNCHHLAHHYINVNFGGRSSTG